MAEQQDSSNFRKIIQKDLDDNIRNIKRDIKSIDDEIDSIKIRIKDTELDLEQLIQELSHQYSKPTDQRDYKKINAIHNKKQIFNDQLIKYRDNLSNFLSIKRQYRTQEEKIATHIQKTVLELEKSVDTRVSNNEIVEAFKLIGKAMLSSKSAQLEDIPEAKILIDAKRELNENPLYSMD